MVRVMAEPGWIEELVTTVEQTHGEQAATTTRMLIDATSSMRLRSTHQPPNTSGAAFVSVIPGMVNDIELFSLFSKGGRVAVQLKTLRRINPFRIAEQEETLRARLASITGFKLDKPDYPDITLAKLSVPEARESFVETMRWAVERVRKSNGLS
jgi:hypothetical protein